MALMLVLDDHDVLSALMIGFMTFDHWPTRARAARRDENPADAVGHAGMEKLTSALSALFLSGLFAQRHAVSNSKPRTDVLPRLHFTPITTARHGYKGPVHARAGAAVGHAAPPGRTASRSRTPDHRNPSPDDSTNATDNRRRPYQGSRGWLTPHNIMVKAAVRPAGRKIRSAASCRRRRTGVPIRAVLRGAASRSTTAANFKTSAGDPHQWRPVPDGPGTHTLTMSDKGTASGEIVRKYLDSGILATGNGAARSAWRRTSSTFGDLWRGSGSVTKVFRSARYGPDAIRQRV